MVHISEVIKTNKEKLIAKQVRKVLISAIQHKWNIYDNKHTAGMFVDAWTDEIMGAVKKLM